MSTLSADNIQTTQTSGWGEKKPDLKQTSNRFTASDFMGSFQHSSKQASHSLKPNTIRLSFSVGNCMCIYIFLVSTDLTWLDASSHLPLISPNGKTGESKDGSADLCTSSTIIWSKGCGHSLPFGVATPLSAARTRPPPPLS